MKKYGLKINLYTSSQGLINGVKNIIENADRDNGTRYSVTEGQHEFEIDKFVNCLIIEISFDSDLKRGNLVGSKQNPSANSLRGLNGMIHSCKKPSSIFAFDNNLEDNIPDVKTEIYEVA